LHKTIIISCGLFIFFAAGDYSIAGIDQVYGWLTTVPSSPNSVGKVVYALFSFLVVTFGTLFSIFFALTKQKAAFIQTCSFTLSSFGGLIFAAYVTNVLLN
jgi:hypothetical protein